MKAVFGKKAFTLVELLIVIAIIGMLSVLSIAGYTSYRKNALTDLAVEGIIAKLYEMKESAIYGVNKDPKCFGLAFVKDGSNYKIGAFKQDFTTGKKQWSDTKLKWVDKGCGVDDVPEVTDPNEFLTFDIDPMIGVAGIDLDGGSVDSFYVRFNPPNGEIEFHNGTAGWDTDTGDKIATVTLKYGEGNDVQHQRNLVIKLDGSDIEYNVPDVQ